ncbi:hypothetical protein C8J57DRAFT_1247686 [Mycena rebaudengoi]|nr:hypothetical protein C8J57DRAFT_1247686 [Mycena rebaudengoi]
MSTRRPPPDSSLSLEPSSFKLQDSSCKASRPTTCQAYVSSPFLTAVPHPLETAAPGSLQISKPSTLQACSKPSFGFSPMTMLYGASIFKADTSGATIAPGSEPAAS